MKRGKILMLMAGLCALAACGEQKKSTERGPGKQMPLDMLGVWPNFGENPNQSGASDACASRSKFMTDKTAFIYMKFDPAGTNVRFKAETAIFSGLDIERQMAQVISQFQSGQWNNPRVVPEPNSLSTAKVKDYRPVAGFDRLGASMPMRIIAFIDNGPNVYFESEWPVIMAPLLTGARARPVSEWDQFQTAENKSFCGAQRIPGYPDGNAILLYNDFRDSEGNDLDPATHPAPLRYSFNFNVRMKGHKPKHLNDNSVISDIALAIDPDTSNGNGQPPPIQP